MLINPPAIEHAKKSGTPSCVHVPVAAADEQAIADFVGQIVGVLSSNRTRQAFLVEPYVCREIDPLLPIADHPSCTVLHAAQQVWVHVGYTRYRRAYAKAFPNADLHGMVISHAWNRRIAQVQGFDFVRVTATSRGANSSSAFSELWGFEYLTMPENALMYRRKGMLIRYADLTELMLMLDIKLGGGVMDVVNEGQKLIEPRPLPPS